MARLEVIAGPMFARKSKLLIWRLEQESYIDKKILVVKPRIDTRTEREIASRKKINKESAEFEKGDSFPAHPISSAEEFIALVKEHEPNVIGIDEAQFFDEKLLEAIDELLDKYEREDNFLIIATGLDMDAWRKPFGIMPDLMAKANQITKLTTGCFKCRKRPATLTYKKSGSSDKQIEVGSKIYEARCRVCHKLPE